MASDITFNHELIVSGDIKNKALIVRNSINMKDLFDILLNRDYCLSDKMRQSGKSFNEIAKFVRQNHIIKYKNNYYRINRKLGYLHPIITGDNKSYYVLPTKFWGKDTIDELYGDPINLGKLSFCDNFLKQAIEKREMQIYGVGKIELNPGENLPTTSGDPDLLTDKLYNGSSYAYPKTSGYQPYSCLGNWYQAPALDAGKAALAAQMFEWERVDKGSKGWQNWAQAIYRRPNESRGYDVSEGKKFLPFILTNYIVEEPLFLYDIKKEDDNNYIVLHLQYFNCRINSTKNPIENYNLFEIYSDKIYREDSSLLDGRPKKYNYSINANLLNDCSKHYSNKEKPKRGWYGIKTASDGDGDKALAAEICMKKNTTPSEIENIDGWYISQLLHLMRCGIDKVRADGFSVKLFENKPGNPTENEEGEGNKKKMAHGIELDFIERLKSELPISNDYIYEASEASITSPNKPLGSDGSAPWEAWYIYFPADKLNEYHKKLAKVCIDKYYQTEPERAEKIFNNCRVNPDLQLSSYIPVATSKRGGYNNYSKIINPNTGRSVNINSSLGKKILKNYINYINL